LTAPFTGAPSVLINYDKAEWITNACRYVVVDGEHRLVALQQLHGQGEEVVRSMRIPERIDCCVMFPLTAVEQFAFSERCNVSNQTGQVLLTCLDKLLQIKKLRILRYRIILSAPFFYTSSFSKQFDILELYLLHLQRNIYNFLIYNDSYPFCFLYNDCATQRQPDNAVQNHSKKGNCWPAV
jgi:hypothetical protein